MADSKRSEINRQNAQKSTGPKTAEGKARSRRNALKHGLRAEVLPLPNEDPAAIQARADAWNDYFQPLNPAEQHLVDECVRATVLSDRCHRAQDAIVARRVREAGAEYEHEQEDEVERLKAAFKEDPAGIVRSLQRTALGCRFLLARWRALAGTLSVHGSWSEAECNEVVRLLGHRQENEVMKASVDAYLPHFYNLLAQEQRHESNIRWLLGPGMRPDSLPAMTYEQVPGQDFSRGELRKLVEENVARLAEREAWLRENFDGPDKTRAAGRAMVAEDKESGWLFLRYYAEARSAFHRNYQALMKSLADEEVEPGPSSEVPKASAPPVEPNPPDDEATKEEPQAVAAPASSGSTAVSPNEARMGGDLGRPKGVVEGREEAKDVKSGFDTPPVDWS